MVEKSYKQTLINKYWQICWTIKRMDPCDRGNGHRAQKENWQVQKYVLNYYNLFHDRQWYFRCAIWTQKVVWLTRRIARIWPVRGPHWKHDEEDTQSTLCARYQTVVPLDPWRTQPTNIKMLHVSEIEPINKYLEKNFMGGFKFSYLNYVKDKTDNLLDEKGEFAQCSG